MRFKAGIAIGFSVGYYLGAKAGRARYEQLHRRLHQVLASPTVETLAGKAKAVADLGSERARRLIDREPPRTGLYPVPAADGFAASTTTLP